MAMKKFKMLNLICESCALSSKEKLVAHYFVYKSNRIGECYPAVGTIAKHCGVSERTVQRATKKLQEQDYITIEKRYFKGRQSSNEYKLNTLLLDVEQAENLQKESMDTNADANNTMETVFLEELLMPVFTLEASSDDEEEIPVLTEGCYYIEEDSMEYDEYMDIDYDEIGFLDYVSDEDYGEVDNVCLAMETGAVIIDLKYVDWLKLLMVIKMYKCRANFMFVYAGRHDDHAIELKKNQFYQLKLKYLHVLFYAHFRGDMVTPKLYNKYIDIEKKV
ncbi:hypothetical protein acsn021_11420 [Anaerocolumna cellulosilytica]|uniref:Uncharacterized protein n=1 Tax=Anaerocolumna cellulosilytica TaxID=433286 RepID=A0A6S6QQG3_9FIRM|nr:helix-turn-helix domain-containing protein [Anaerocolumna cellulosilytica]MBB5194628.1 DNA-binding transcriptional regulator YhcF (GntR family) [Anaerocolumna cellulosilytica]BCJ93573.1 hypothetical protein acsn021_11420 [Anaerocolumna cellulosilytica]